jgi:hypothetical protein
MKKQLLQQDETYFFRELSRKIQQKSNFVISEFYDCKMLALKMEEAGVIISAHTLGRFFSVLKSEHRPYTSTLNLLANYVGYTSFNNFKVEVLKNLEYSLSNPYRLFDAGDYSFTALELAIHSEDWKSMQAILESFKIEDGYSKNRMSNFLGYSVRQHQEQEDFLNALSEIENGRLLFFESFVDEDDPVSYYSKALAKYYLQTKQELQSTIFHSCFVTTKKIYSRQNIHNMDDDLSIKANLNNKELHFHQISRMIELRILIDGMNGNLIQKMDTHLQSLFDLISKYSHYEKCWLLARAIKAFAFSRVLDNALGRSEFKQLIFKLYEEMQGQVESIAEMIIQLTVHAYPTEFGKTVIPPIGFKTLNENNSRIAIESATALIYAENPVKKHIEKNLALFTKNTGNEWVLFMNPFAD